MTMTRRRLLDDSFKKTVEGNPAIATDSLARMYPGIEMQGWTEQAKTTGANLIDYTQAIPRNGSQSVEIIDGGVKWTGNYYFKIPVAGLKKNQNYIMSYESDDAGFWVFSYSDGTFSSNALNGQSNTTDPGKDCSAVFIYKSDPAVAGQDMVFTNIMLNEGTTALPYEPYTGGQPSPSPDYPQEIVSAGKYNEDAQKWEYEITIANAQTDPDKNQTVTLTADRPLTKWDRLEKRGGQWGWVYKSEEIESYTDESVPGEYYSTTGQLSTGAQVWYETATETFAPLSESEREAMNALHTYRPTTVLSNQQGCQMTLTYKSRKGMS